MSYRYLLTPSEWNINVGNIVRGGFILIGGFRTIIDELRWPNGTVIYDWPHDYAATGCSLYLFHFLWQQDVPFVIVGRILFEIERLTIFIWIELPCEQSIQSSVYVFENGSFPSIVIQHMP